LFVLWTRQEWLDEGQYKPIHPMDKFSSNFPHIGIGMPLFFYGLYIMTLYFRPTKISWWRDYLETRVFLAFGLLGVTMPTYLFITKDVCPGQNSDACSRTIIHWMVTFLITLGALFSHVIRMSGNYCKTSRSGHGSGSGPYGRRLIDFGIPLACLIAGFFVAIHDHQDANILALISQPLHVASAIALMSAGIFRLAMDFYPDTMPFYAMSVSGIGVFWGSANYSSLRVAAAWNVSGSALVFIWGAFCIICHLVVYVYFLWVKRDTAVHYVELEDMASDG
jgi:hypothetical protein